MEGGRKKRCIKLEPQNIQKQKEAEKKKKSEHRGTKRICSVVKKSATRDEATCAQKFHAECWQNIGVARD